jgi:hypothetical protein
MNKLEMAMMIQRQTEKIAAFCVKHEKMPIAAVCWPVEDHKDGCFLVMADFELNMQSLKDFLAMTVKNFDDKETHEEEEI